MKNKLVQYSLFVFVLVGVLFACEKENEPIVETTSNQQIAKSISDFDENLIRDILLENNGRFVEANFIGRIIDQEDQPIQGATVSLGGQQQTTDANGIVTFLAAGVQEHFAYASVSALGYTNGSRVMVPNIEASGQNAFTIKLFRIENTQIIPATGGEVVVENEGGSEAFIHFNEGFMDENGNPYTDDVFVSANYLNPLDEDTANTMPGDLYGMTSNYEEVALGSYGMINVELRGTSGQKLQITNTARISLPIHPNQMAASADQVPMWSFNEATGVWIEETVAQKEGDYYVADVNHFSFWNCDAPFSVVDFTATVIDQATGSPLAGVKVNITYANFTRFAWTNSNGQVSGKIPSGQTIGITITSHPCGTVLYSNPSFGPFTSATNITIPITIATQQAITVSGTVTNCANQPVTNGYVTYSSTNGQFGGVSLVTAGTHNYMSLSCVLPAIIDLEAGDMDTGQVMATTTVTANPTAITNLNICGGIATEYIRYSIDTAPTEYETLNPYAVVELPNFLSMGATRPSGFSTVINGNVTTLMTGIPFDANPFTTTTPSMVIKRLGHPDGINVANTVTAIANGNITNPITFDITAFGPVGFYIDVSFSGQYVDNNGAVRFISGAAHILRDF
ncbi:MAG: astroprincin family protein [Bacteroidota bacterium]